MRTFGSDNFSSVDPAVMAYLDEINQAGHAQSYEGDTFTLRAETEFQRVFDRNARVIFVSSGTGANILGLQLLLTRPYEAIITAESSHVYGEETGAVAANLGAHIYTLPHHDGKIRFEELKRTVKLWRGEGFHAALPKVVSISNPTEFGTCYTADEIQEIADWCHRHDLFLHVDGCRLANAAVALDQSLRALTYTAGVDVLSFGGAKNGLMSAEAIVISNAPDSDLLRMQKQALQLVSKQRFLSAQFVPYLADELWHRNAATANRLAWRLGASLRHYLGDDVITRPVQTNQVFCRLPADVTARIRAAGHVIYDWPTGEVRFVASWDNTDADVDKVLKLIQD